jgi:hypothetical protein
MASDFARPRLRGRIKEDTAMQRSIHLALLVGALSAAIPAICTGQENIAGNRASDPASVMLDVIEYRQLPLAIALRTFSEQTGMNVVASTQAGQTPITLYLENVSAQDALATLTKAHNLFYRPD